MDVSDILINHDAAHSIFYKELKTGLAYLKYRQDEENVLEYMETYVPEASRGKGIASDIVEHALDFARDGGYKVIPSCPFVSDFVRRYPGYQRILQLKKTSERPPML